MDKSTSSKRFSELLTGYYVPLEIWFLRNAIAKAHRTSTIDATQSPPSSSVPDLVFYILRAVIYRQLNTGSITAIEQGIRRRMHDVIKSDYADVIKRKLDDVYRTSSSSNLLGSRETERETRFNFIVLLNDLHVSTSHLDQLVNDVVASNVISQNFMASEVKAVEEAVLRLQDLGPKLQTTLKVRCLLMSISCKSLIIIT